MTAAERKRMRKLVEIGCIVCRNERGCYTPPEIHHILDCGRRIGHLYTIPLCTHHHKQSPADSGEVGRHQNKTEWMRRYGSEAELLEQTNRILCQKGLSC